MVRVVMKDGEEVLSGSRRQISATLSVSRKVPMEQYGSAEAYVSLQGVTAETSEEEIDEMLENCSLGWKKMSGKLRSMIDDLRDGRDPTKKKG